MKNKLDRLQLGLVAGFLFPLMTLVILHQIKYGELSVKEFVDFLKQLAVLTKVLSLSVVPNLLIFFIFIWTNKLRSARGVLMATIIFTFLIIGIKVIA